MQIEAKEMKEVQEEHDIRMKKIDEEKVSK